MKRSNLISWRAKLEEVHGNGWVIVASCEAYGRHAYAQAGKAYRGYKRMAFMSSPPLRATLEWHDADGKGYVYATCGRDGKEVKP